MNERAIEKERIEKLSVHERTLLALRGLHDAFSGHVNHEDEHKDCGTCVATKKANV